MIGTVITVLGGVSSALGSYNLGSFVAARAIARKRSAKQAIEAYKLLKTAVNYAGKVHHALQDGLDPEEIAKAKAIIAKAKAVKDQITSA